METFCADEKGNKVPDNMNIRTRTAQHLGILRQAAAIPSKSDSSDSEFFRRNAPLDVNMLFSKPPLPTQPAIPEESLLDDDPFQKRYRRSEDNKNNSAVGKSNNVEII